MHTQASKQPAKKLRSFSLATTTAVDVVAADEPQLRARRRRCQDGELLDRSIHFRRDGDSSPNTAWRNRGTRARPPAGRSTSSSSLASRGPAGRARKRQGPPATTTDPATKLN
jgi:hypothetical protein